MADFKSRPIKISKSGQNIDKNDINSTDNIENPMTPPARENTEVDLTKENSAEDDDFVTFDNAPVNKDENLRRNIEIELDLIAKERGLSDIESDFENVIKEMEKIVVFADDEADEEFHNMELIRRDYENKMSRVESRASFTTITPREDWGFTTRTIPELNFTWGSTVNSTQGRTSDNSRYTNQYLRSTASVFPSGRTKRQRKREKTGVRWSSRMESRSDGRTLFCFGQYEEMQIEKASRPTSDKTELSLSRNASRLALESREAMFRRAMSLLSARCTSVRQETDGDKVTLGAQIPKYFYVTQDKPQPMEPLKAWRGYHGNIYFEPININPLKGDLESERARTSITRKDPQPNPRTRTSVPKLRSNQDKENRPFQESRSESRQTNKSSVGSRRSSTRPMAYLDKQTVLNRLNESIQEDIVWLEGTENTGSLAVRPKSYPEKMSRDKERDLQYNKERIKKGSVAHKLYIDGKSKQKPKLSVSGGKFTPPNSLSPLLRTQTQYSLSSQRLTTNSPDPYHLNESKLPPLDQIRASLKHMDSKQPRGKLPYNKSMTITDDMKPFVKYSPDVVAKFAQQANIC
ncbi:uncharacterized protein LOC123557213 isoform X1 [Mercenaria mercenaria]|uniref:uncharacterized protein LOC123557213 isoform X1 n=1 Tax=Mercenaria mercenaria TaxID=6596 RepID=UPI00234E7AC7|nr:uncharacterized protein LOC123557213 isoform X1 [Mercenaria mercenaria]